MLSKLILIRETDHQRAPVLLKKRKAKRMNWNSLSLYGFKGLEKVPGHESPWHRKPQGRAAAWVLQQEKNHPTPESGFLYTSLFLQNPFP